MVQLTLEEGKLICAFSGRLDTVTCMETEKSIIDKVEEAPMPVVFDLQQVNYVASMFLRICIRIAKEVGTENFSVINVCPLVKKVFKVAGFDKQITIL